MNRIWTQSTIALCAAVFALHLGACMQDGGDDGAATDLTAADLAVLPDTTTEVDLTALAQASSADPSTEADAPTFDSGDATALEDEAVDDDDDATDDAFDAGDTVQGEQVTMTRIEFAALLKWGLHPRASDALRSIGVSSSRIMQTIGNAAASAGTHAQDGTVNGHPYSAATDISVRGLSNAQIRNLLERLGRVGFAAWFRQPGFDGWPSSEVRHIHAVYANAKMKSSLRSQVRAWLAHRNGLVSNTTYRFYTWSATARSVVRAKFAASAGGTTNAGSSCVAGGYYCGGDKISGNQDTLYRCTGAGAPTPVHACANGCAVRPGRDDACR